MPASPTEPTDPGLSHREILEILAGLLAALFTAVLSSTIVSNALPTIIADLEGTQTQYTWVIAAEEREIRHRIAELEAVEQRLLGTIRDGLSGTPVPHQAANGYPEPERQPFG